jgi:hypothetical protein
MADGVDLRRIQAAKVNEAVEEFTRRFEQMLNKNF